MSWRHRLFFLFVCAVMLPGGASLANGDQLHIVATHGILADVVRNVAGDHAEVISLVPVGADQHGFAPTPSDLTTVAEADVVFINGAGWEETLLPAVESAGEGGNLVNASACVGSIPFGAGGGHDDHDDHGDDHDDDHADDHDDDHADDHDDDHGDDHDDDHADDHDHEDEMSAYIDCDAHDAEVAAIVGEEEHDHADVETLGRAKDIDCLGGHDDHDDHEDEHGHHHGEGSCDPHLWMDPHNVIYWALTIRDTLSSLDHDNEAAYAANAAAYAGELVALETEFISSALEALPHDKRVLVTNHGSMGYFATSFDFEIVTMVVHSVSTVAEPSARDVAAVVDVVRAEGVPAIFSDIHLSDVLMNTIASETGVEVVGLHSDSLGAADGPAGTYLDYMRYNVNAIVEALQGDWS